MSSAPGGQRTELKRRNNAKSKAQSQQAQQPTSTKSAGFGGSSSSLLKLYSDEAQGLKVDPLVVLILAVGFIFSVIALHVIAKLTSRFI